MPQFSIKQAVGYACQAVFKNYILFVKIILIQLFLLMVSLTTLCTVLIAVLVGLAQMHYSLLAWPVALFTFSMLLLMLKGVQLGFIMVTFDLFRLGRAQATTLFSCFGYAGRALGAQLIYMLLVGIGLMACVVPGLIAYVRLGYYQRVMVDDDSTVWVAFKKSWLLTRGNTIKLCMFALFFTVFFPLYTVAQTYVYNTLNNRVA